MLVDKDNPSVTLINAGVMVSIYRRHLLASVFAHTSIVLALGYAYITGMLSLIFVLSIFAVSTFTILFYLMYVYRSILIDVSMQSIFKRIRGVG